jgi:hypothetical protein
MAAFGKAPCVAVGRAMQLPYQPTPATGVLLHLHGSDLSAKRTFVNDAAKVCSPPILWKNNVLLAQKVVP